MSRRTIPLTLGYVVEVAPRLAGLRHALAELGARRVVVITNPTVRDLHGAELAGELGTLLGHWHEMPDGEAYKSLDEWARVLGAVLEDRPDRDTHVLAFGGGVVGDLAGFVAATALRGLPLVQVPTTLLAMIDASVGGKTAVNMPQGKNLVGAFHQPKLVWAPLSTLATLPEREFVGGLGELVKHAVIEGEAALAALEAAAPALARQEESGEQIAASIQTKARIVEADPWERGARAHLNLGHTLGHAVEAVVGFGELRHGECVAIGLLAVVRLAEELGWAEAGFSNRLAALYGQLSLPTAMPAGVSCGSLVRAMGFDKKRERGMVRLVIVAAPGQLSVRSVEEPALVRLAELAGASA